MSKHTFWAAIAAFALACTSAVRAQSPDAEAAKIQSFIASLHFRDGEIAVPQAQARFRLGSGFRYLEQADARRVLEEFWGNPPDDTVLGMVVPSATPLDSERSWAVVVTFSDEGYVSDEDAAGTDYAELLQQMKEAGKEENDARREAGYGTVELVGWAVPPRYDAATKKLYWAKELAFEGNDQHTLNYDVRVLGRRGFLSLNAVANMSELGAVQSGMQQLLPVAEFDAGARYADYDASSDKVAGYGIAALIGGGIAAKTGLFAKLGALLLAGKKFIVFIVLGLFAFLGKLFGGRNRDRDSGGTVR
ncbi:MAG: DUF2167 domain-containing protein [Pseudomonadota bacterium]